jgi:cell division protein FtsN
VIKSEKPLPKEEVILPGLMARDVPPMPVPLTGMEPAREAGSSPKAGQVKVPPLSALPQKEKTDAGSSTKAEDKETGKEKYLVQVTSCKSKKIAEEVVRKIAKAGFKPQIATVDLKNKGTWYRVLLTNLDSKGKAKEAAQKIDRILKGNKSAVRVQKR